MRKNGRRTLASNRKVLRKSLTLRKRTSIPKRKRVLLGRYIVADSGICHGEPTFRGTRIMVWQVPGQVGEGMDWDDIVAEWRGSLSREAIAEAVELASKAFLESVPA